jgi:hypothetical protein
MPTNLEIDVANFTAAARPYGDKVWISRQTQVFVREWMVENEWIQPGQTPDTSVYAAAFNFLIAAGTLPQKQKTAEEIVAEAEAEKLQEAKRKMGVMFSDYEDEIQERPTRKIADELINTDRRKVHNDSVDRKMQHVSDAQERHAAIDSRMQLGEAIPGLVDESWSANEVYVGGRVARYATSQAVEKAKANNVRVRAEYAAKQSQAVTAAANQKRGI